MLSPKASHDIAASCGTAGTVTAKREGAGVVWW
jgi:hypothetical protein